MIRIGFYVKNGNFCNVDCRDVYSGNPGIGGTEYTVLLLATQLQASFPDMQIVLYAEEKGLLPDNLTVRTVKGTSDLYRQTLEDNIDILVLTFGIMSNSEIDTFRSNARLKIVLWAHLTVLPPYMQYYAQNSQISRIVFAAVELMDLYRDMNGFEKSAAIYIGVNLSDYRIETEKAGEYFKRPHNVTYLGSLVPMKGFHLVAKAWPLVVEARPDAVLNVIGSGKLYNRNSQLGKYGIAEETYENMFMKYLTDSEGMILPSVRFHGLLSNADKNRVLTESRVAVPNPTGKTEICPQTAIEMQAFGALVATVEHHAYLDTICPTTGLLFKRQRHAHRALAEAIVTLLGRDDNRYEETMAYLEANFAIDKVADKWHELLKEVSSGEPNRILPVQANGAYRMKNWKECNRRLKRRLPWLPSLFKMEEMLYNLGGMLKREHLLRHLYLKFIKRDKKYIPE